MGRIELANISKKLEKLQEIAKEGGEALNHISRNLKEKGVECGIITPIIDQIFKYDILSDVEFEKNSR